MKIQLVPKGMDHEDVINLAEEVLQLKNFTASCAFNPYLDTPEAWTTSRIVEIDGEDCTLKHMSEYQKRNCKRGSTRISDNILAGIFCEIARIHGTEKFHHYWKKYMRDFVLRQCVGNPFEVAKLVSAASVDFECPELPDRDRIIAMKLIAVWVADFDSGQPWCETPINYAISSDQKSYTLLRAAMNASTQTAGNMFHLRRNWRAKDAQRAFLWCIAAKVHPIRLLNFIGLWMTHRENQPIEFSSANTKTQAYEVELKSDGKTVGYETAKPAFSGGFIAAFSGLVKQVTWFTPSGTTSEPITDRFLEFANMFVLEDFYMVGGLTWQLLPLSLEGEQYYSGLGLCDLNLDTVKELSPPQAAKFSAKVVRKARPAAATGNPLFDAELLESDDDDE